MEPLADHQEFWSRQTFPDFEAAAAALRGWETQYNYQRFSLTLNGHTPAERSWCAPLERERQALVVVRRLPAPKPDRRGVEVWEGLPAPKLLGGIPTISPDGEYIVGPIASLRGFYIASACNVGGLSISASVGRALADLIVDGSSEPDSAPCQSNDSADGN